MWYHHTDPGFWVTITSTAWWQLLIVIATALLTQLLGHVFLNARKKQQKIIETASTLISSGRQIKTELSKYKQTELMFNALQASVRAAQQDKDQRVFERHRQMEVIAHDDTISAQNAYEAARNKFIESAYLLINMEYERLGAPNNPKFLAAINKVVEPDLGAYTNVEELKQRIFEDIYPAIQAVEEISGQEIYLQNRSLSKKILDTIKGALNAK